MKYVIILGDGMADYPLDSLNGKTPLEIADKPFIDALAKVSEVGLCRTVPAKMKPGSDVANLSALGYDPARFYTGRSPLEAASIGVDLDATDVAFRANLVSLSGDGALENCVMKDYSAGEISTPEAEELIAALQKELGTPCLRLYAGVSYRHCLVLKNGKTGTTLIPPHDIILKSIKEYLPQGSNKELLIGLMKRSREILKDHPVNLRRRAEGKNTADSLWFWGEGTKPALEPFEKKYGFKGAMISAVDLLKGIGKLAGMSVKSVPGATGNYDTNFEGKADAALEALDEGADFSYVHLEAPDECGHQGDAERKIYSIEQIDKRVVGRIKRGLDARGEAYAMLIMPDHPTPIALRTHTADPVPYLIYRSFMNVDGVAKFDEKTAAKTGNFVQQGYRLIEKLIVNK